MGKQNIANRLLHEQRVVDRAGSYDVARYAHYVNRRVARSHKSREIKTRTLVGLLLMVGGFALMAYEGIRYTLEMQSGGAISSAASRHINLPISPLVGITAMFAGYALIVREED